MADFCQECSIETFGQDYRDMAGITTPEDEAQGKAAVVFCEGCGLIQVDQEGKRIGEAGEIPVAKPKKVYYRYSDYRTASGVDEFGDPVGNSRPHLRITEYKVLNRTPKGVWIEYEGEPYDADYRTGKKFILNDAKKRFACETKELALLSFLARKKRQLQIYKARVAHVDEVLDIADRELNKLKKELENG